MKMGLVVRATQGTATCPGLEGWRVRGEQCQRLADDWSKRKKSSCWQDLSCEGPTGKAPQEMNPQLPGKGDSDLLQHQPLSAQAQTFTPVHPQLPTPRGAP